MRNPNFLVLDEPTNDLDIQTLQIFEEYLADFPGCVIIVSHDRYFMDKVVDHLLVFNGGGAVQDFPGNYTQYREWCSLKSKNEEKVARKEGSTGERERRRTEQRRRMTYKEHVEYAQLEKDIAELEAERKLIEEQLLQWKVVDRRALRRKSKRLPILKEELDNKEMRWLELSEIEQ